LAAKCLKLKEIDGDGNCLFRSIGDQILGDESVHSLYRAKTVQFIRANQNDYMPFIEDDVKFDDYCDWM